MPLKEGSSPETREENVKEMIAAGHDPKQAVAAAYREQRESSSKDEAEAAGVMFCCGDRVLLMRRADEADHGGEWAFPAGGIETGETDAQAALREAQEETGYAANPDTLTAVSKVNGFALFVCPCEQFPPKLNEEHDGFVWAHRSRLPTPLHPGCAEAIADWFNAQVAAAVAAPAQMPLPGLDHFDPFEFGDTFDKASARVLDGNGWFEVKGNPLSKVGVFQYRGRAIRNAPDPDRMYRIYRPASELGDQACIDSFKLLPWIDDHTMLGPRARNRTPAEDKGIDGVIGEDVYLDTADGPGILRGNIKVFSERLRQLIDSGKKQLSAGYTCVYDWTAGVFDGKPYDAVQRRIRGNHLASVQVGRMGPDVAVLDGRCFDHFDLVFDAKDAAMAEEKKEEKKDDTAKPKGDEAKPDGGAESKKEEKAPMDFDTWMAGFKQHMPTLSEHFAKAAGTGAELSARAAAAGDSEEERAAKEKAEKEKMEKDKAGEGKDSAVDPAEQFKALSKLFEERNRLAARAAEHIGTFDAAEMTTAEVAAHACSKLGLKPVAGQELAMLEGWLAGRPKPGSQRLSGPAAVTDSKEGAKESAVSRYLKAA